MSDEKLIAEIERAMSWLEEQARLTPFGEVAVKLVLHGGKLSRVERTLTSKMQPEQRGRDE